MAKWIPALLMVPLVALELIAPFPGNFLLATPIAMYLGWQLAMGWE